MSTEDPSISSTRRRLWRTRAESVCTFMPASTFREHAGTSTREPSSSTTHTRQTLTGVRLSSWHRVGVSIRRKRHASRMVEPAATSTPCPSMVMLTRSAIEHLQLRQARRDRVGRRLAEPTDRRVAHGLGDVAKQHHIGLAIAARRVKHALEDLLLALGADAARDALTARLVAEEPGDAQQHLLHVRVIVKHHHGSRAERRADRPDTVEAQRNVDLVRRQERAGRPTEQ